MAMINKIFGFNHVSILSVIEVYNSKALSHKESMEGKEALNSRPMNINKYLQKLLSECQISVEDKTMSIETHNPLTKTALLVRLKSLTALAYHMGCSFMNLYEQGILVLSLPIIRGMPIPRKHSNNDKKILEHVWNKRENYITIVRESDTKVLLLNDPKRMLNNNNILVSDIIGKKASQLWTSQALELRKKYLDKNGYVNCLEYQGRKRVEFEQGIDMLHPMAADFQKVTYLEEPCILGIFRYS